MFFIKNVITSLSEWQDMSECDKWTSLLHHVGIIVIKNVYRTGLSDVFHQKCSYFSIIQSDRMAADSNKHTRLLEHVEITVIKNVYRTGPSDVFRQKCSYFSIKQSDRMAAICSLWDLSFLPSKTSFSDIELRKK